MLQNAIDKANEKGYLNGLGIEILEGAGAYICGEESALMNSMEGKRGEVRYRPPFPPERGLFGKPTIINNVETLVNVPLIILKGAQWYGQLGTEESKGTKVFSVSGDVAKPGVYEMEMGCLSGGTGCGSCRSHRGQDGAGGGIHRRYCSWQHAEYPVVLRDGSWVRER